MTQTQAKTNQASAPVAKEPSISERFVGMVMQEFNAAFGNGAQLTPMQKKLAQHLYLRIDKALQDAEAKRIKMGDKKLSYTWQNINLTKLAMDAMHRINLGLDGLVENHISPIAYWNSTQKKYDLDLRVGYVGKDYYRRKMAVEEPVDIVYELVYDTDEFRPIKKNATNEVESFEFEIKNPWNRGKVVGGFGYIMYSDPKKNKLVIVTEKDFQRSEKSAKANEFWKNNREQMQYKTIVHRTTEKISVDPEKINESYMIVEQDDMEETILGQIEDGANKEPIDIQAEPETEQEPTEQPQEETTQGQESPKEEKKAPQQQTLPQEEKGPGF